MIGVLVSHSLKDYFYQSQVDDLTSYGQTISRDIRYSPQDATMQVLNTYQRILDVKKFIIQSRMPTTKPFIQHR